MTKSRAWRWGVRRKRDGLEHSEVPFVVSCILIYVTQRPRRDILSILAIRETYEQGITNIHKAYHET